MTGLSRRSSLLGLLAASLGIWRVAYGALALIALAAAIYMVFTRHRYAFLDSMFHSMSEHADDAEPSRSRKRFGLTLPLACLMVCCSPHPRRFHGR